MSDANSVAEAMRQELLKMINAGPFDGAKAHRIGEAAMAMETVLFTLSDPTVNALSKIEHHGMNGPYRGIMQQPVDLMGNSETQGTKLIREIVGMMPGLIRAQKETPELLVNAIAAAKREGLTDVEASLTARLHGIEAPESEVKLLDVTPMIPTTEGAAP